MVLDHIKGPDQGMQYFYFCKYSTTLLRHEKNVKLIPIFDKDLNKSYLRSD